MNHSLRAQVQERPCRNQYHRLRFSNMGFSNHVRKLQNYDSDFHCDYNYSRKGEFATT